MNKLILSKLPKTWIFDIDGVVFVHNSHLDKGDVLIKNIRPFLDSLPKGDNILLLSARKQKYAAQTKKALKKYGIRYDSIIFGLPVGERILVNDRKPSGLVTAIALSTKRDKFVAPTIKYKA